MVVPSSVAPSEIVTIAFGSVTPVIVGLVKRVVNGPVMVGPTGAVVSTVITRVLEATDALPTASVATAVRLTAPESADVVIVNKPALSAVAVPTVEAPLLKVTDEPGSAEPVTVTVVSLVIESVADEPVSSLKVMMVGATGAVRSTRISTEVEAAETLPAVSVAVAVML